MTDANSWLQLGATPLELGDFAHYRPGGAGCARHQHGLAVFGLPDAIGLLPIPMSCALAIVGMDWMLRRPKVLHAGYGWFIFVALMVICLMAAIGLAYSIYPDIVIGRMTLWEAAAATKSLQFIFWGAIVTLPAILGYTLYVHRVFSGKATELSYE